jgi:hypothetical protein
MKREYDDYLRDMLENAEKALSFALVCTGNGLRWVLYG